MGREHDRVGDPAWHEWGPYLAERAWERFAPTMRLGEVSTELARRLCSLFFPGDDGRRPMYGGVERFHDDPHWRQAILFYEYFNGDDGAGLGASHQTGWTGLVADLLRQ